MHRRRTEVTPPPRGLPYHPSGTGGGSFFQWREKQKLITRALLSATSHLFDKDAYCNLAVKKAYAAYRAAKGELINNGQVPVLQIRKTI